MFENDIKTTKQHCWIISIAQNNSIFFFLYFISNFNGKKEEALFPSIFRIVHNFPIFL